MERSDPDHPKRYRKISILLFILGTFLGLVLIGSSVYADFESTLFDVSNIAENSFRLIRCPVFLSPKEAGAFSTVLKNPENDFRDVIVKAHISRGHLILMREVQEKVRLSPLQTQLMDLEVSAEDAAYGHLILAKVVVTDTKSATSHRDSCGIIVLELPDGLKGWHLFWLLFILSSSATIIGMGVWWKKCRSASVLEETRSIIGLGSLVLVGLICISLAIWELAAGVLYISLLMVGVIVPHFLIGR